MWFETWLRIRKKLQNAYLQTAQSAPMLSRYARSVFHPIIRWLDKSARKAKIEHLEARGDEQGGECFVSFCQQPDTGGSTRPRVSVIVPNYNHADFLRQRLDAIYEQTYRNFEVILLDDCSSDGSHAILQEYAERYPDRTRLVANGSNSGGVFFQWEKGLSLATGDLIWIAESDDFCSDNFLESLVPFFNDEAVTLAYCRTVFVDGANETVWTIEEYLSDIDASLWKAPFIRTAHEIVRDAWALKNIVPNVSSAVFRHPGELDLLTDDTWKAMRICGDWMFYLHLIRGGVVAYTTEATNYYRIHTENTSVSTYSKDIYYQEHELVGRFTSANYKGAESVFETQRANLVTHWQQNRPDFSEGELTRCYDIGRVTELSSARKPAIMMAGYAFSAGGGETFPIQLANLLKGRGYHVTFLSCDQEPREEGVRRMLRSDIPVVNNFYRLEEIVRRFGIDIIHSHHAWVDNTILDILPADIEVRTVVSLHGMYEMTPKGQLKTLLPRLVQRSARLVYTAEKNVEPFKEMGFFDSGPFVKIGNALSVVPISPIERAALGIAGDAFVLCLVSRAIPEKGWKEAVEAVGMARELSGKDVQLILIGEGPEYDALKDRAPDYVHLLGFRKNIRDYYAASDLGFLPSRFSGESFPLTVIDSLLAGTPVLASDKGEIPDMLRMGDEVAGHVFSLRDGAIPVREVAEVIAHFIEDRAAYDNAKAAVVPVAKKFDPEVMCDAYEEVYGALAS